VISPLARRNFVGHGVYDHTSVLKMIEWRWGLAPLTARDAAANNLAEVLDLASAPNLAVPHYTVPATSGLVCQPGSPIQLDQWTGLQLKAQDLGWRLVA
jgi:phospholipase C